MTRLSSSILALLALLALPARAAPTRAAPASLPFTLISGHIVVAVALNHARALPFLFAPYAPALLGAAAAAHTNLTPTQAGTVQVAHLAAGTLSRQHVTFAVTHLASLAPALGFAPAGIIGAALTEGQPVRIDYQTARITLPAPDARPEAPPYSTPAGTPSGAPSGTPYGTSAAGTCVPWPADQAEPFIEVQLDGKPLQVRLAPDLPGALYLPQARLTGMAQSQAARPLVIGFAAATPVWALVTRAGSLGLGGYTLVNPLRETPVGAAAITTPSLGNQILSRFTLTLFPAARRICLAPNARAGTQMQFDRSGLTLIQGPDHIPVIAVVAQATPAAQAGLHPGQRLLAIDGRPTRRMTLDAVRDALRRPGKIRLRLTIANGRSRPRVLRLGLRDLV